MYTVLANDPDDPGIPTPYGIAQSEEHARYLLRKAEEAGLRAMCVSPLNDTTVVPGRNKR
jgi:hypothetical protein